MLSSTNASAARSILEDIENGNYKKALKDVDKRLKKTDSEYFKVKQIRSHD
jgi:hypothetical protein